MKNRRKPDEPLDAGTQRLVDDLRAKPASFDRDEIIRRAERYQYHSYRSDDPMCTVTLIKHLGRAGFRDLAELAMQDRYEQGKEESDKWAEETAEGRAFTAMVKDNPAMQAKLNQALDAAAAASLPSLDDVLAMDTPDIPKGAS